MEISSSTDSLVDFTSNPALPSKESDCYIRLLGEAQDVQKNEPELRPLLEKTVLHPRVSSFATAVASTMVHRLFATGGDTAVDPDILFGVFSQAYSGSSCTTEDCLRHHSTRVAQILLQDVLCVMDRDPAMNTLLEVILFAKGFASLACHRVSHWKWLLGEGKRKTFLSLWLQSTVSATFGVDIHPGATIGAAVMFDHGTGIVIGETAVIGSGSTLLHGVTLGGTGKESGDRHPKVGRHVLIGAGAKILGNIKIGEAAKIGAGSVVLRSIPAGATAVGAPAKIIGHKMEADPARTNDQELKQVNVLHKSMSAATFVSDSDASSQEAKNHEEERNIDKMTGGDMGQLCPYRDYTFFAFKAPPDSVTILSLMKYMVPLGFTSCQIGPILFELDQKNVGYVHTNDFQDHGKEIISRLTELPSKEVNYLYDSILADAKAKHGSNGIHSSLSKKLRVS